MSTELEQRLFDALEPFLLKLYLKIASGPQINLSKILKRVDNIFGFLDLETQIEISFDLIKKKVQNESLWIEIVEIFEGKFNSLENETKVSLFLKFDCYFTLNC